MQIKVCSGDSGNLPDMQTQGERVMQTMRNVVLAVAMTALSASAAAQFLQALKLMKDTVIPASNIVFSVGKQAPKTDAEWAAVQKSAESLATAARQLLPMGPDSGREEWAKFSDALGASARKAADAAKARNLEATQDAGDELYESCEGCHRRYMKK
jgi:hypothetical protein